MASRPEDVTHFKKEAGELATNLFVVRFPGAAAQRGGDWEVGMCEFPEISTRLLEHPVTAQSADSPATTVRSPGGEVAGFSIGSVIRQIGRAEGSKGGRRVQIMLVFDTTKSMCPEIPGIQQGPLGLVNALPDLNVEVALILFRDILADNPQQPEIRCSFTRDRAQIGRAVQSITTSGGGNNNGESSFDAVMLALRQFSADSRRVVVLVTDDQPHVPDGPYVPSFEAVKRALRESRVDQLHFVIDTANDRNPNKTNHRLFYDLNRVFDGIVCDLSGG
ncbi:MAG: VWA domain-containing protein, partial [Planctomycetes bacterium]|nr:VWA domain-containing protein [Planctomycetota bacterium]